MCYLAEANGLVVIHWTSDWYECIDDIKGKKRSYNDKGSTFELLITFEEVVKGDNGDDGKVAGIGHIHEF